MSYSRSRAVSAAAAALFLAFFSLSLPAHAGRYLWDPDGEVLAAPLGDFAQEIGRIAPLPAKVEFRAVPAPRGSDPFDHTAEVEARELRAALKAAGMPDDERRAELIDAHRKLRDAVTVVARASSGRDVKGPTKRDPSALKLDPAAVPEGLPAEFAHYLRGTIHYHRGESEAARRQWLAVLALPEAHRRNRSVWAAFMVGKSYVADDPRQAAAWFSRTRELAGRGRGFPDALGLAASSYGWEGRAALLTADVPRAIWLYLTQLATGDPTALNSLAEVAETLFVSDFDHLVDYAGALQAAPQVARVLVAYAVSRGTTFRAAPSEGVLRAWLADLEAKADGGAPAAARAIGADRLAWAAYTARDFDAAERWLKLAPPQGMAPAADWIRAKLLVRAGRVDEAAPVLDAVAAAFAPNCLAGSEFRTRQGRSPQQQALGDRGIIELARGRYANALGFWLRSDDWDEAAYVAERVLTLRELTDYVDAGSPPRNGASVRDLLARRLARAGRWPDARRYASPSLEAPLRQVQQSLLDGGDELLSPDERAECLWAAARVCHRHPEMLYMDHGRGPRQVRDAAGTSRFAPTEDELQRVARSKATPRAGDADFFAADLARRAAALMPDESDETAAVLHEAGCWIKAHAAQDADRFYKALVRRCGTTKLGREARAKRWFP